MKPIRTAHVVALALCFGLSLVSVVYTVGTAQAAQAVTSSDHIGVGADFDSALMKNTPSRGLTTRVLTTIKLHYGFDTLANGQQIQYREVCLAVLRIVSDNATGNNINVTDQYGGDDLGEEGCAENVPASGLRVAADLSSADVNVSAIAMTHTSGFCCDSSGEDYTTHHPAGTRSLVAHWTATEAPAVRTFCLTPADTASPPASLNTYTFRYAATITALVNGVSAGTPRIGEDTDGFLHQTTQVGCPSGNKPFRE